MIKSLITALAASILPLTAFASDWQMDIDQSSIEFTFSQGSSATQARFDNFTTDIRFDPDDLENASIAATIDIGSFDSGNSQLDGAVSGQDWFATSNFPRASFQSTTIIATDDGNYAIEGTLTIRDNAVSVTLTGPIAIDRDRAEATMAVTLNRTDFGVGQGQFEAGDQVGHEVPVVIKIVAGLE